MQNLEIAHPHDMLVRRFLTDPELMADLLLYYTQKLADQQAVNLLDLKRLECKSPVTIDEQLVEGIGDLRFSTSFKGNKRQSDVYLLFEHQSKIDRRISELATAYLDTIEKSRMHPSHISHFRQTIGFQSRLEAALRAV